MLSWQDRRATELAALYLYDSSQAVNPYEGGDAS